MNIKTKGILTIISAILILSILNLDKIWKTIINYYLLLIYYNKEEKKFIPNYKKISGYFFQLIKIISSIFIPIGVFLSAKLGIYIPNLISIFLIIISHITLLLTNNKILANLSFIFIGISIGIGYFPIVINSCFYFPKSKGLVLGIIFAISGILNFVLKYFADSLINPYQFSLDVNSLNDKDILELINNTLFFIKILIIIYIIFGIGALILINPFTNSFLVDREIETKQKIQKYLDSERNSSINNLNNELNNNDNININLSINKNNNAIDTLFDKLYIDDELKKFGEKESICSSISSIPFYQLIFIYLFSNIFDILNISKCKELGKILCEKDLIFLQNNIFISEFSENLLRMTWGLLIDIYGFKTVYLGMLLMQIFVYSTFYFSLDKKILFIIYNFFIGIIGACNIISIPLSFEAIFGMKNGFCIYGFFLLILESSKFLIYYLIQILGDSIVHFLSLFLINTIFSMISLIVLCFLEEKKFDYSERERKLSVSDLSYSSEKF